MKGDPRQQNLTIYRKCECGETAHDYRGEYRVRPDGWHNMVYRCRNCGAMRFGNDARTQRLERAINERLKGQAKKACDD